VGLHLDSCCAAPFRTGGLWAISMVGGNRPDDTALDPRELGDGRVQIARTPPGLKYRCNPSGSAG
jgi:hypothetical protein